MHAESRPANWLSRTTDAGLILLVMLMAVLLLRREFGERGGQATSSDTRNTPTYSALVDSNTTTGHLSGSVDAVAKFVVFNDLECPFCAAFHKTLGEARARHRGSVSVRFVHFPLNSHRFAKPAALAVECAGKVGRFDSMVDVVFKKQDSLGLASWRSLAAEANVSPLDEFERCLAAGTGQFLDIEAGVRFGRSLNAPGTPTIYVNGWKLLAPPDSSEIDDMISRIHSGKSPVS